MLKSAKMCLKPINFGVTFIHRLQKLWGEKADGWEKTEAIQVGNNLSLIDIKEKKMKIMFSEFI